MQKSSPTFTPQPDEAKFAHRIDELRQSLANADPQCLAQATGTVFAGHATGEGLFRFALWGKEVLLSYPEWRARYAQSGQEAPLFLQALLLYYFVSADGAPLSGRWISFSELPNGKFYVRAFQGYTGSELTRCFQGDRAVFERAAQSLLAFLAGHEIQPPGDFAFRFQALPRVPLLAAGWEGDEDFPASYQVLFDAAVSHYMPTDGCAILGSTLTKLLLDAHRALTK
jgi:hypothetical protein